jgi:hypothetical protein
VDVWARSRWHAIHPLVINSLTLPALTALTGKAPPLQARPEDWKDAGLDPGPATIALTRARALSIANAVAPDHSKRETDHQSTADCPGQLLAR